MAVLVAAAVAGLAPGLVLTRNDSGRALAQGPPHVIAEGSSAR